ncbi:MAG: amidohydrolase family protein [Dehalococcoidia bacterium]
MMAIDTLIKGGLIVDGSGEKPYRGNVAIKDGKIVRVGGAAESADRVIDADGLAVAPGFWDIHTHYDAQLLWDPIATSSCWHGVTTVVMGNCGFTVAPCRPDDQEWMVKTLARVEGMNVEVLNRTLPWPWESFGEYLDTLDKALGVNAIAQVGHSAVRRYVMGEEASQRAATDEEVARMKQVVAESLKAGGMGFTTSRVVTHWDGDGLPVPSRVATLDEYYALLSELNGLNAGFVELASGPEFSRYSEEGMARLVELARISGRPVCWNAISQVIDNRDAWRGQLDTMLELRRQGVPFFALGHTQPDDFEFKFDFTNVFDRWPTWQKVLIEPDEIRLPKLKDPAFRQTLKDEMLDDPFLGLPFSWERVLLVRSSTGRYHDLEMQSLTDIGKTLGKHPLDAALDVALDEDLQTQFRQLDSRNPDPDVMMEVLKEPHVAAGFSDAGAHLITEVNTGFATHLLGYWVRQRGAISLEAAVRRVSAVAAEEAGITDRGHIREGLAADITIFDPETVAASDRVFVNDLPGGEPRLVQYAQGIEYTLVNGQVTMQGGQHTGALAGRTLRSGDYAR